MTSSSSSSHFLPVSISQSWNHEVFLSFRGEDTRKNFVDHLYTALVQQGIQTYKDDETLARGESIGPSLQKAIQESQIAIIVFSRNYADSSWCLDELAYIIVCMDKTGQVVMPVFYGVDPSDVRKQKGKYGEAFDKHEEDNKDKVESWRKALTKAGNLSGWVPKDFANGHEAKCIKNIVATISSKRHLLKVNKDLIGIESRLQELKSKIEMESHNVRIVGIWGVGGGGKTTLAYAAYTEISHQFEAHCFLEDIRDESNKHGWKKLQETFLSLILKTNVAVESEMEGKNLIKKRLCHKRVLVVLDDVDDLKQLEVLVGSHNWFGDGSRIIITTRDRHLLSRKADAIYEVSLLSHDEAMELFDKHAYREDKLVEDYEMLSLDVVSYAGGLPLALEVLGSFLYDKDKEEWLSVLEKLKHIPELKVIETLKISYDGLKPDEKEIFLDIACYWRRYPVDEAMRVLDACSFHTGIGVKVLVQKSLVKVTNGRFDIHDLIEEMAHYIVRGGYPNNPEKHSRIWKEEDIVNFCNMKAGMLMENEALALPWRPLSHVEEDLVALRRDSRYASHPHLPHIVSNMKKLRWIKWEGYPTSSFPSNFQPTKLGCLIMIGGRQKELWQGRKYLPNLKILELGRSNYIIRTPDFIGLPFLQILNLEFCSKLQEIHPSIGYHERLVLVNMDQCIKLKMFPPIIQMKKLETLILSGCPLQKFPDFKTNMDSLVTLRLGHTDIEIVPHSVGQVCTNLMSFDLSYCSKLKTIDGNFCNLKNLKDLNLHACSQLQSQESTTLKNLMKCTWLRCFHKDHSESIKFPQFPHLLRKLNLSWCNLGNGDIPSDICELSNLQVLDLSGNKFSQLHSILSRIPCLKFLDLSYCESLIELPGLPSSIAILKAQHCDLLQSVGDLSNCKKLWKVSLWGRNKFIGGERVLNSMLRVNASEDRFMSVTLPGEGVLGLSNYLRTLITLKLPHNWYNDFSGFLLCADNHPWYHKCIIVIKQEISFIDSQPDCSEEFDKNSDFFNYERVGYVPFGSLRHTSWWNPTYTDISFEIHDVVNPKIVFVPRNSQIGDSTSREFWDSECEDKKTFEIKVDSKSSSIMIVWSH